MIFLKFLRDQLPFLGLFITLIAIINFVLWLDPTQSIHWFNLLYLDVICLLILVSFIVSSYLKKRSFLKELHFRTQYPHKSYNQTLNTGKTQSELIYQKAYNTLVDYGKEENLKLINRQNDQTEYVDSWVHEIKIPLAALQLLQENIQTQINSNKNRQIKTEISQISHLVDQVLYYSRLDNFTQDYLIQRYRLKKIVNQVALENMTTFLEKHIQFEIEGEDTPILTDQKWLAYILTQLFSNALKYTPDNGSIKAKIIQDHKVTILQITDTGVGIPKQDISRIFDKGFTGENGRKQDKKSTGLGLYLAQKMAQKLGHELTVSSTPGKGTTFSIQFPFLSYYNDENQDNNLSYKKRTEA
ncbi:sensor histidine kinase [Holzapfeliella floricola]|uniref:histidine kinase n=1 Tax=Holzapfeliella floricola DSM 23037 = JCM 16512 TaxID=1423744 RepID=A0A0R2DRR7_9LACO|nr:ATP-binding protein [Holzapfeliella floricola]KRN04501.1 his Kinase A domain protein [Holzapfeliella floricola DSM 23037 = JCM 16512]